MKIKLILILILTAAMPGIVSADQLTLDSDHSFSFPVAKKITSWEIIKINASDQTLVVRYLWRADDDSIIGVGGRDWQIWTCTDTCFTDIFQFEIRQQDVGTKIGSGFRALIWNKMKADILTPGNDGTFD